MTPAQTPRILRILAILLGVVILLWLPVEDTRPTASVLFAAAICALVAARIITTYPAFKDPWRLILLGFLSGLATSPVALALMAVKSGLHSHTVPEFTPEQIFTLLRSTPLFTLAGLLIGVGLSRLKRDV